MPMGFNGMPLAMPFGNTQEENNDGWSNIAHVNVEQGGCTSGASTKTTANARDATNLTKPPNMLHSAPTEPLTQNGQSGSKHWNIG